MEFDKKDKIIFESLLQDCRTPLKVLAKRTNLSHPTVIYRIKKLEEQKYILRYDALINLNKLLPTRQIFVKVPKKEQADFEEYCTDNKSIMSLARLIHKYNYSITAPMTENMEKKLIKYLSKEGFEYKFFTASRTNFGDYSLFDEVKITKKNQKVVDKILKLDKKDIKMIELLTKGSGRDSILELARKTRMTADQALYRFKRLNKAGYIIKNLLQMNNEKFNVKLEIITFKVNRLNHEDCFNIINKTKRAATFFQLSPNQYLTTLFIKDLEDLETTLEKIYSGFDDALIDLDHYPVKNWVFLNRLDLEKVLLPKEKKSQ